MVVFRHKNTGWFLGLWAKWGVCVGRWARGTQWENSALATGSSSQGPERVNEFHLIFSVQI